MHDTFLRPAVETDIDLLYEWVCDEETRKNSLNLDPISYDEHKKWFAEKLSSDKAKIFIYYCHDIPVGQVRIDIQNESATVSYSIDKNYRGLGHGTNILVLLEHKILGEYPNIKELNAVVKLDNTASGKIFEKLDYSKKNTFTEYTKTLFHS